MVYSPWGREESDATEHTHSAQCSFSNGVVFFLLFSCMSSLSILEIKPLLVVSFEIVFTYSVDCLFILLMIFFAV